MRDEIIEIYEKDEAINRVLEILKKHSFDDLIKTKHFLYSIEEKGTDPKLLRENFAEFSRVKLIVKRKHKTSSKISYDFYYKLDDKIYLMYAISFEKQKPALINAFQIDRNFERFKNWIVNTYKDQLIGQ